MHKAGLANQATSVSADDGLSLTRAWVTAVVKCAPPDNKPLPEERAQCHAFLERELELLTELRVVVCLGAFAYQAACAELAVRPRPKFGHGVEVDAPNGLHLLCSFHPSQQNTFTGRLTEAMLDDVFSKALALSG
jgi:uracil-DNA glycosylase family 4